MVLAYRHQEAAELRGFDLILHPVTFPLDDHGVGVVQEPVQNSTG